MTDRITSQRIDPFQSVPNDPGSSLEQTQRKGTFAGSRTATSGGVRESKLDPTMLKEKTVQIFKSIGIFAQGVRDKLSNLVGEEKNKPTFIAKNVDKTTDYQKEVTQRFREEVILLSKQISSQQPPAAPPQKLGKGGETIQGKISKLEAKEEKLEIKLKKDPNNSSIKDDLSNVKEELFRERRSLEFYKSLQ